VDQVPSCRARLSPRARKTARPPRRRPGEEAADSATAERTPPSPRHVPPLHLRIADTPPHASGSARASSGAYAGPIDARGGATKGAAARGAPGW
jgi:hypothetical protein